MLRSVPSSPHPSRVGRGSAIAIGLALALAATPSRAQPPEPEEDVEPSRRLPPGAQTQPLPPPGYAPPPGYGAPPPEYGAAPPGYAVPPGGAYYYGYGPPPPIPKKRRSTGMMVSGIVLTALGGVTLLAGAVVYGMAKKTSCTYSATGATFCSRNEDGATAGTIAMLLGGGMIAAGIPLTVVGARKVPVNEAGVRKVEAPRSVGTLFLSPTGASFRYSF